MQWWIDTAGKLGPALIALLVLLTTRSQNRALNAVTARAANVEDQKFKLALLDRRLEAVDAIRDAVGHYHSTGMPTGEAQRKLIDALRVAQLVFEDAHEKAISECIMTGLRWRTINARSGRTKDGDLREKLIDDLIELDETFERLANELLNTLVAATRVCDLPPLRWPSPWWQSFASHFASRRKRLD